MATRRKMDLLMAVEQIVEKAQGSGLSSEFYRKADKYIKYLSERLELTKEQSVMMALFIDNSLRVYITIEDICSVLCCKMAMFIKNENWSDVVENTVALNIECRMMLLMLLRTTKSMSQRTTQDFHVRSYSVILKMFLSYVVIIY